MDMSKIYFAFAISNRYVFLYVCLLVFNQEFLKDVLLCCHQNIYNNLKLFQKKLFWAFCIFSIDIVKYVPK